MMDTIAAIATGGGRSAIGIIRLSGENAIGIVNRVFKPKRGGTMDSRRGGELVYGELRDADGGLLDLCMCTVSRAPHSYTGEDTAELQCHGSPVVLSEALKALFKAGARQAEAGEFTKRAFLNGKLDLTEAEAVIDLIDAETGTAARNAAGQLGGAVLDKINGIYSDLTDISSHFEAEIDFPDDDIDEFKLSEYAGTIERALLSLRQLSESYERGRYVRDGVSCAIIGKPNVGKSELLNALVGYDRVIVTDIAGTTRDTVEETCVLGGVLVRLIDTAGIRETTDTVEAIGIERARAAAERADMVLAVTDVSAPLTEEDYGLLRFAEGLGKPWIIVENKMDISEDGAGRPADNVIRLSAKTGEGLGRLADEVKRLFGTEKPPSGEILTNARQAEEVRRAIGALEEAEKALRDGLTPDIVLTMTEEAMEALSAITGASLRDDIIDRIFHRFCVGK